MVFILVLKPKAKKELDNLEESARAKARFVLEAIIKNPFLGKKLSGELPDQYSMRAWPFRIVYEIRKNVVSYVYPDEPINASQEDYLLSNALTAQQ